MGCNQQQFPLLDPSISNISNFYREQCVFVTGGTGFLGKVLVEKLLRSCPGIETIYLLIRPKKDQDVHARLTQEFHNHVVSNSCYIHCITV